MITTPAGTVAALNTLLPPMAMVLAIVAVAVAAWKRIQGVQRLEGELAAQGRQAAALDSQRKDLQEKIDGLQHKLERARSGALQSEAARRSAGKKAQAAAPRYRADPRLERFLDQVRQWCTLTSKGLPGAAGESWNAIDELTHASAAARDPRETEAIFQTAAATLVEHLVMVTDSSRHPLPAGVESLLEELAAQARVHIFTPRQGERWDDRRHEVLGRDAAAGQQPGTISRVAVRGLIRPDHSILKARIYLFD